uniref:(northern house mosquito) hypothetical protein n=1 Tax=Culex pipiens TaxID=7175 RepID=A0A8D8JRT2_CULPI
MHSCTSEKGTDLILKSDWNKEICLDQFSWPSKLTDKLGRVTKIYHGQIGWKNNRQSIAARSYQQSRKFNFHCVEKATKNRNIVLLRKWPASILVGALMTWTACGK